jgi:hypothetical protein
MVVTFSRDIAYSSSPAAWRASARLAYALNRTTRPSRTVNSVRGRDLDWRTAALAGGRHTYEDEHPPILHVE